MWLKLIYIRQFPNRKVASNLFFDVKENILFNYRIEKTRLVLFTGKLSQPGFCLCFFLYLKQTPFFKECDPIAADLVVIILKFLSIHAGGNLC